MPRDERLVERAVAGDRAAVRRLVRRLLPVIRARVAVYLKHRVYVSAMGDADDLTQSVWIRLWKDDARLLRAYDRKRGKTLEGYVGMVAQRELWLRRRMALAEKRRATETPLDSVAVANGRPAPEDRAATRQVLEQLVDHLWAELGDRGREVLSAVYLEGRSPREAAEALGVTTQVVYNWQHKVRTAARAFLERGDASAPANGNGNGNGG